MNKILLRVLILGLVLKLNLLFGGTEPVNMRLSGASLLNNTTLIIADEKWPNINVAGTCTTVNGYGKIVWGIDERVLTTVNAHTTAIELKIIWTNNSNFNTTINNVTLTTSYDPLKSTNTFTYSNTYGVSGAYQLNISVLRVYNVLTGATITNSLIPANLYLEAEQSSERYYQFTPNYITLNNNSYSVSHNTAYVTSNNELEVYWQQVPGAEEYELEWSFMNAYTNTVNVGAVNNVPFTFSNNSTRIRTSEYKYRITLNNELGYILYRVRPIGRIRALPPAYVWGVYTVYKPFEVLGTWSVPDYTAAVSLTSVITPSLYGTSISHYYYNNSPLDENKNSQYSATFAEDGKKKEVLSYFDGSLRSRQVVTKTNTENQAIIAETFYDHQGRPAVNVLPTPAYGSVTPERILKYYEDYNLSSTITYTSGGTPAQFSKKDFDLDVGGTCPPTSNSMTNTAGSSRYYSSNNPDQESAQAYIPNGENYPFTQTIYTPDNTGRIRKQGGVGNMFKIGSGHETTTLYSTPLQADLDELFGSEAGTSERYKKNTTIDPNGQITISYLNKDGKVVATTLAGNAPANTNSLAAPSVSVKTQKYFSYTDQNYSNVNKFDGSALVFSYPIVPNVSGVYTFTYNLQVPKFNDACIPSFCYDCDYNLEIVVRDECGSLLYASSPSITPVTGSINYTCGSNIVYSSSSMSPALQATLTQGKQYFIEKKLSINPASMNTYLAHYADSTNNTCIKTRYYFNSQAKANIDLTDCDITTCSVCVTKVNAYISLHNDATKAIGGVNYDPNYIYVTPTETAALIDRCNEACKPITKCENQFKFMLADVSPTGQYGQYDVIGTSYTANAYPLSVFNPSNMLPKGATNINQPLLNNMLNMVGFLGPWTMANPTYLAQFTNCLSSYTSNGTSAYWKNPYFYNVSTHTFATTHTLGAKYYYDDAAGIEPSKVFVSLVAGVYSPSVAPGFTIKTYTNGLKYVYPHELAFLKDFVERFKPSWARSLVHNHPEWCYFEWCDEQSVSPPASLSSEAYDNLLRITDTYSAALSNTLIGLATGTAVTDLINTDPYFYTGRQGYNQPDPAYPINYLKSLLQYRLDSFLVAPGYLAENAKAASNRINRWSTMYYDPTYPNNTWGSNSLTDFPSAVIANLTITGATTLAVVNKEWLSYRDFYLAAKAEVQMIGAHIKAISKSTDSHCGCFNGCLSNPAFNPFYVSDDYNGFAAIQYITNVGGIWGNLHSIMPQGGFNQPSQPCNLQTMGFYSSKQKRFIGGSDLNTLAGGGNGNALEVGASLQQSAEYQVYQSSGQCPTSFKMLSFLNDVRSSGVMNGGGISNINLYLYPSFTKSLYDQVHGALTYSDYFLTNQTGLTTGSVVLGFCPGTPSATSVCSLGLSGLGAASPSVTWSQVVQYGKLEFTGGNNFNVTAWADDDNDPSTPAQEIVLTGTSCITSTCSFPSVICQPNQSGKDLLNLINNIKNTLGTVTYSNVYGGVGASYALTNSINPESYLITDALRGSTSFSLATNSTLSIPYNVISVPVTTNNPLSFYLVRTASPTINFVFSIAYAPSLTFAPAPVSSAAYYSNLIPDEFDPCKFYMTANFITSTIVPGSPTITATTTHTYAVEVTMSGDACVSVGDCAEPIPISCNTPGYKSLLETRRFIKELKNNNPSGVTAPHNVSGYNSLGTNLKAALGFTGTAYINSVSQSTVNSELTLAISSQTNETSSSCSLILTPATPSLNWWNSIQDINNIEANDGITGAFNMTITTTSGSVIAVSGQSCFKLENCNDCVKNAVNVFKEDFDRFDGGNLPSASDYTVGANVTHTNYAICETVQTGTNSFGTATLGYMSTITNNNYTIFCSPGTNTTALPDQHTVPLGTVVPANQDMMQLYIDYSGIQSYGTNTIGAAVVYEKTISVTQGKSYKISYWYNDRIEPSSTGSLTETMNLRLVANTITVTTTPLIPGPGNPSRVWRKATGILAACTSTILTMQIKVDPGTGFMSFGHILFDDISIDRIDCDDNPTGPPITTTITNECEDQLNDISAHNGLVNYKYYTDSVSAAFKQKYIKTCSQSLESIYSTFTDKVHHYTLYYYDQAGNLVKTVPPEGVKPVDLTVAGNTASINYDRENATQTFFTEHELATKYKYNSLNQLMWQSMPDHDAIIGFISAPIVGGGALPSGITGNDLDFYSNGNNGFLAGNDISNNGVLYTTTNGGSNWAPASIVSSDDINKIQFMNNNYGFAVTSGGAILATTNGTTWSNYNVTNGIKLNSLFFYPGAVTNEYYGLVVGDNSNIYFCHFPASGAPGFTQVAVPLGLTFNINVVKGYSSGSSHLYLASGSSGIILQTALTANGTIPVFNTSNNNINNAIIINDLDFTISNNTGPILKGVAVGKDVTNNQGFAGVFNMDISNPQANTLSNIIFTSLPANLKSVSRSDVTATPSVITDDEINISGDNGAIYRLNYNGLTNLWMGTQNAVPGGFTSNINHIEHSNKSAASSTLYAFASNGQILQGVNTSSFSIITSSTGVSFNGACITQTFNSGNPIRIAANAGNIYEGTPVSTFSPLNDVTQLNVSKLNAVSVSKDNSGVVFAAGNSGTLLKSGVNGNAWATVNTGTNTGNFTTVYAFSSTNAAVGDNSGRYFIFGPTTMTASPMGSLSDPINKIWFKDGSNGYLVGDNGLYRRSVNSGSTFATVGGMPTYTTNLMDVHFFGSTGLIVGSGPTILKSTDDGYNWTAQTAPPGIGSATLRKVYITDNTTAYAFGDNGIALRSLDAGATWSVLSTGAPSSTFNAVSFNSAASQIVAVGTGTSGNAFFMNDNKGDYSSRFFYDKLGRLIISQNAKQFNKSPQAYSYTIYDALGRIINVGEIGTSTDPQSITNYNNVIAASDYTTWLGGGTKTDVTTTVYDNALWVAPVYDQQNLRKRVSGTYIDTDDNLANGYTHGSFYSYDIHGNVNAVMHIDGGLYNLFGTAGFKLIEYKYDLVSGKVNEVIYQRSSQDEFRHKYDYDADNRITNVLTSNDGGMNWKQDAKYFYYKHGPLARVELGPNKTQGLDYAYTLQGWVKGVNSAILTGTTDPGKDAITGTGFMSSQTDVHKFIGNDAYAYNLIYYTTNAVKDYQAINTTKYSYGTGTSFDADPTALSFMGAGANNSLYNGNISGMETTIPYVNVGATNNATAYVAQPQLTTYKYDQLNRINEIRAYSDFAGNSVLAANAFTGTAATLTNTFRNEFTYDANGNIETQKRYNNSATLVDDLTYKYDIVTGGSTNKRSNRLYHINDGGTTMTGDINDMGTFVPNTTANYTLANTSNNYGYDEVGNLVRDDAEEIYNIDWNVYGKIKTITRYNTSVKPDLEFEYDAAGNRTKKIVKPKTAPAIIDSGGIVITYYTRDAQGNILTTYEKSISGFKVQEQNLYGSTRLGNIAVNNSLSAMPYVYNYYAPPGTTVVAKGISGNRSYEESNHLGNVLTVISDRKLPVDVGNNGSIDYFVSDVLATNDYYAFGSQMPGRNYTSTNYRYGFNGMEKDDEVKGGGNTYTSHYRGYDPRLGRWFSGDPKEKEFPEQSPYNNNNNNPVLLSDPDGDNPILWLLAMLLAPTALDAPTNDNASNQKAMSEARDLQFKFVTFAVPATTAVKTFRGAYATYKMLDKQTKPQQQNSNANQTQQQTNTTKPQTNNAKPKPQTQSNKEGKGKNKLEPNPEAEGDHSTFEYDNNGGTYKYETYKKVKNPQGQTFFDKVKRFDGGKPNGEAGAPHNGLETPHVQPKGGATRTPESGEVPNNPRFDKPK